MTQLPKPIADFIDRVNAHDREAVLGAFADNGFVDDWGRIFTGREAIAEWSDREFVGARGTLTVERTVVDGNDVTVTGDWRSAHANGRSRFEFRVAGDRIASMTIREG